MTSIISNLLSRIATVVKGRDYQLDKDLDPMYLAGVAIERAAMRVRATLQFGRRGAHVFVGRGARLRARGDIKFGRGVTFGPGTYVDAASRNGVKLGDNTSLGRNSRIECTGSLQQIGVGFIAGNNVGLGTDSFYGAAGGISLGDDTIVGNYVSMHSENHVFDDVSRPVRDQGVTRAGIAIGRGCWIGAKVTVLDGAQLGDGCVVAAGAVLAGGVYPANGIYGGVPARRLKERGA